MNLAVIIPGEVPGEAATAMKESMQRIVSPEVEIALYDIKGAKIQSIEDIESLGPKAVEQSAQALQNGCQAIVLNGA